jgi:lysophospholipase
VITGRKFANVDPDPQGVSRVEGFLKKEKAGLIGGFVGLLALLAGLIGGLCVFSFFVS